jgi:hypothetical protein
MITEAKAKALQYRHTPTALTFLQLCTLCSITPPSRLCPELRRQGGGDRLVEPVLGEIALG